MKIFLVVGALVFAASAGAAENIGTPIPVAQQDGAPAFAVEMIHDTDSGILTTFTVQGSDLVGQDGCLSSLAYRFYNSATDSYVGDWGGIEYTTGCAFLPGTYPIQVAPNDPMTILAIIHQLPNLKLVLSVNYFGTQYKPTKYIDIAALCVSNPGSFQDLTTSKTGCAVQ
jgi:hypothetical protein